MTIGVNNQMFDAGESAYFTFVKTPNPSYLSGVANGLDQNEADDADNIQYSGGTVEANGGFLKVVQIQGGGLAAMDIAASNISGSPQGTAFVSALGSGSAAAITAVRVYNSSGTLLEKTSGNADGGMSGTVTVTISGGVAHVAGVDAGYKIEWDTSSNFDQVKVTDTAGKFDIGGFGINQPSVQSVDIGAQTQFEDDGPTVSVSLNAGAEVRVDESLGQNGAPETEGGAAGLGQVTVQAPCFSARPTRSEPTARRPATARPGRFQSRPPAPIPISTRPTARASCSTWTGQTWSAGSAPPTCSESISIRRAAM